MFGEIALLTYLIPALNCPSAPHRVTLSPDMAAFVFHWSFNTCISSLPKLKCSVCFLYAHGEASRAIQTG